MDKLKLFRKYRYLAYRVAGQYTAHIMFKTDPATDIMDLYQEAQLGIWRALELDLFDPDKGNIEPFMRTAANLAVRNYLMVKAQRVKVPRSQLLSGNTFIMESIDEYDTDAGALDATLPEALTDDTDIEEDVWRSQMMEFVTDALWDIGELEREIIKMSFGIDYKYPMSHQQIADTLGFERSSITKHMHTAMQDFSDAIKEYIEEDGYNNTI